MIGGGDLDLPDPYATAIFRVLAADMACGEDDALIADMESLGRPEKLPPPPFRDWGVRLKNRFDLWRYRHEA